MLTAQQKQDLDTAHTYALRVLREVRTQPKPRGRKHQHQAEAHDQVTQRLERVTNDLIILTAYT